MSQLIDPEKGYDEATAALLLGLTIRTVRTWLKDGKLAGECRDRAWHICGSELLRVRQASRRALCPTVGIATPEPISARPPLMRPGEIPPPRATKVQVQSQRAEAVRLRAEGLTVAEISMRLGKSHERVRELLKPVPPNHCRKCGGEIEQRKQYHLKCRPSYIEPTGGPSGRRPAALPRRQYGEWTVLDYVGKGKWLCRCRCGFERPVNTYSLKGGRSHGCQSCSARERCPKVKRVKKQRRQKRTV